MVHVSAHEEAVRIIQTEPYEPQSIAVAPDGSVWTVGVQAPEPGAKAIDRSRDVLRRFDQSGRFLDSAIPLSVVGDVAMTRSSRLAATNDRVAWYAGGYTRQDNAGHYFEFFPETRVLRSYDPIPGNNLKTVIFEVVITPTGHVYAFADEAVKKGENQTSIFCLDRGSGQWRTVQIPSVLGLFPEMRGNKGETLVVSAPNEKTKLMLMEVQSTLSESTASRLSY